MVNTKENLRKRYEVANKALASLHKSLASIIPHENALEKPHEEQAEEEYRIHRDSVIKRFEYTLDTTWKYLKFFLEESAGVVQNSPKSVMRECFKNKIMSEHDTVIALEMIDARNMSSHIYREEVAEAILAGIPKYYSLMQSLLKITDPATF